MADPELSASERAGERVAFNTAIRALGEVIGKVASLVLFAVMGRKLGEDGLGVYVLAISFATLTLIPMDLGFDRSLLREGAVDRARSARLMVNVLAVKLSLALPTAGIAILAAVLLGYEGETRMAIYVMLAGLVIESLGRTAGHVFQVFERSGLLSIGLTFQRILTAGVGISAVLMGSGPVGVAWAYVGGAVVGTAIAFYLALSRLPLHGFRLLRQDSKELMHGSATFAMQDVATLLLFRLDAVILAAMASTAAVGRYGAAYRVFESTWFITVALAGAFTAMFTYLTEQTEPRLSEVFGNALRLSLVLLMPCAIGFGLGASAIETSIFGADFEGAAGALRILAPAVVLLGVATMATNMLMARRRARSVLILSLVVVVINVTLNVLLIPPLEERGAAIAMLVTETVLAVVAVILARQALGKLHLVRLTASSVAGSLVMAAVMLALGSTLLSLFVGFAAYVVATALVERKVNPEDAKYLQAMLGRRLAR